MCRDVAEVATVYAKTEHIWLTISNLRHYDSMYAICLEHPRKRHLITLFGRAHFTGHLAERMTH